MPSDSTPTQPPAISAHMMEALQQVRQRVQNHWINGVLDDRRGNRCLIGWIMTTDKVQQYDLVALLSSQLPPSNTSTCSLVQHLMQFSDSRRTNRHVLELIDRVIAAARTS